MKTSIGTIALIVASATFLAGCASSTLIQSDPPGAKVYLDGEYKGETPYRHRDEKIVFSITYVKLEKAGYEDHHATFSRSEQPNVGAIVGGFFIWPIWLWAMDYNPSRTYKLEPSTPSTGVPAAGTREEREPQTKAGRLRELKHLLDEGILTQEEFDREKKKVLEEE